MNDYTTTVKYEFCGNRLPCGLCRLTNTICPMQNYKTYEVTCSTEVKK